MRELGGRGARGTGGEEYVVGRFKTPIGLQPCHREKRRWGRRRLGLHQRQRPKVTQQAAVLGSLVNLVRGSPRLGLRGHHAAEQQQDHRQSCPGWHNSCQISPIIPETRQLRAAYAAGTALAKGIRNSALAASGLSESASRAEGP